VIHFKFLIKPLYFLTDALDSIIQLFPFAAFYKPNHFIILPIIDFNFSINFTVIKNFLKIFKT
jgi:hypothetical protein